MAEYAAPGLAIRTAAKPSVPNPVRIVCVGEGVCVGVPVDVVLPDGVLEGEGVLLGVMEGDCVPVTLPNVWEAELLAVPLAVELGDAVDVVVPVGLPVEVTVLVRVLVGVPDEVGVCVGDAGNGTAAIPLHPEPDVTVATATPLLLYVSAAGLKEYTADAVATHTTSCAGDTATNSRAVICVNTRMGHVPSVLFKYAMVSPVVPARYTAVPVAPTSL